MALYLNKWNTPLLFSYINAFMLCASRMRLVYLENAMKSSICSAVLVLLVLIIHVVNNDERISNDAIVFMSSLLMIVVQIIELRDVSLQNQEQMKLQEERGARFNHLIKLLDQEVSVLINTGQRSTLFKRKLVAEVLFALTMLTSFAYLMYSAVETSVGSEYNVINVVLSVMLGIKWNQVLVVLGVMIASVVFFPAVKGMMWRVEATVVNYVSNDMEAELSSISQTIARQALRQEEKMMTALELQTSGSVLLPQGVVELYRKNEVLTVKYMQQHVDEKAVELLHKNVKSTVSKLWREVDDQGNVFWMDFNLTDLEIVHNAKKIASPSSLPNRKTQVFTSLKHRLSRTFSNNSSNNKLIKEVD